LIELASKWFRPICAATVGHPRQQCSSKTYVFWGYQITFYNFAYLQWNSESCVVWRSFGDVFQAWLDDGLRLFD